MYYNHPKLYPIDFSVITEFGIEMCLPWCGFCSDDSALDYNVI